MSDTITIDRNEWIRLRIDAEKLAFLEAGGVDNWEGYHYALNPPGEPSFHEVTENLRKTEAK